MTTTPTLREAAQQFVQDYENGDLGDLKHYARSMRAELAEQAAEQAEPVGWTDADADAARLALELECLLTDKDIPTPAVSRWWDSATEALDLHRKRMAANRAAPPAPAPTWPEWAEQILKTVREFTGYDGYDDTDGVDLPSEVREALEELAAQADRLKAKTAAPAAPAASAEPVAVVRSVAGAGSDAVKVTWMGGFPQVGMRLYAAPAAPAAQAEPQKYDDTLMPFLHLMRGELHANAAKGDRPGWLQMDRNTALLEIYWHTAKLSAAMKNNDTARIAEHCADVGNMAMMLADVCGVLPEYAPPAPARQEPLTEARARPLDARRAAREAQPGDSGREGG
ncbi:MAG: hypothetical protein HY856_13325 [Burkholderiales bacterium]|nr:hypothetical protein [Burkholderiales bacterium]